MYSTCLFCTKDLGSNEVLETLPIGRRIAFDSGQGRLWVICGSCGRWNLVPFDSRLETIDACEARFSTTRMRFSTDNIGIARLREGLELVRIGTAQRPEFAAWRYGDRFASRRRRNMIIGGTLIVGGVGAVLGLHALVGSMAGFQFAIQGAGSAWEKRRIATRFTLPSGGEPLTLSKKDVKESSIRRLNDGVGFGVSVPSRLGVRGRFCDGSRPAETALLTGGDAIAALGQLLPVVAGLAGSRRQVASAVTMVEVAPPLEEMLATGASGSPAQPLLPGKLSKLGAERMLALEMLANEQAERNWLAGELKLLERQWREAERLAAIADSLAMPVEVTEQLEERRRE